MVGSDPLEQSSLAIGDTDSVQEIRNASLGHTNTKSDLDDIHDGSKQPRRGSSSKRGSSGRGLFFHCPQGPQGYEDVIHFLRVRVPEKSENARVRFSRYQRLLRVIQALL